MKRTLLLLTVVGLVAFGCYKNVQAIPPAPQSNDPSIRNADLHSLGASSELERDLETLLDRTDEVIWAGYSVPMVRGMRHMCCGGSEARHRVCHLENGDCNSYDAEEDAKQTTGRLLVMYRLANGKVQKIRTFSRDCELDAGGLPVYWWSFVNPRQSMALLETHVRRQSSTKLAEAAVQAIAHHAEAGVDELLENIASDRRMDVSKQAIFWLGAVRREGGFESLKRLIRTLKDAGLREHITFALYLSEAPAALPELIDMARNDLNSEVRSQALFWLSQKAGKQAVAALERAVEEDPDLDVKKKAVFGLSQLPNDEGVPLLIDVAQRHRHPNVRKQAMFWLGQSGDQRALAFFEQILLEK